MKDESLSLAHRVHPATGRAATAQELQQKGLDLVVGVVGQHEIAEFFGRRETWAKKA